MNTIYVLAYDDHADGNTYLSATEKTNVNNAFNVALLLLDAHDNVCIVTGVDYNALDHDFYSIAPYAINISCGIYAKFHGKARDKE